ncbi:MAG TPA: hypothetical protein VIX37_20375 [Candidatus Sulfotelmatobacter sp.]
MREVERLQEEKKHDRKNFVGRASSTDPDAHGMRNGEGGTVPSYNEQRLTDVTQGLVVKVEATTDAIDYRQLQPALERCERTLGKKPKQIVADGDYTHHASVQTAAACGVDFDGSWPRPRDPRGGDPSRAAKSLRLRWRSKPRWRPKRRDRSLCETFAGRRVPACLDQRALRLMAVPVSEPPVR